MGESSSLGHETFLTYVESQNLLSVFRMNNLHTIAVPYQICEIRNVCFTCYVVAGSGN